MRCVGAGGVARSTGGDGRRAGGSPPYGVLHEVRKKKNPPVGKGALGDGGYGLPRALCALAMTWFFARGAVRRADVGSESSAAGGG